MTFNRFLCLRLLSTFLPCLLVGQGAWAQLPDGSVAPDFSAVDLDGEAWGLFSLLDSGQTVVLNFGATWCFSCWADEHEGALNTMHNAFGPDGSGDVTVLFLEFDDNATLLEDLSGSGTNTVGDWMESIDYPIIDSAGSIHALFGGSNEPFACLVCPDGLVTNVPVLDFDTLRDLCLSGCDNAVNDPAARIEHLGLRSSCEDSTLATINMTSLGADTLTAATFNLHSGNDTTEVTWTGTLSLDSVTTIELGFVPVPGPWNVALTSLNDDLRNFPLDVDVSESIPTKTEIEVKLTTDHWPEETGWRLVDDTGVVLEEVEVGSLAGQQETTLTWDVELPSLGCYEMVLLDAVGDGLQAELYGNYPNGSLTISNIDAGEVASLELTWEGGEEGAFFERVTGIQADEVSGTDEPPLTHDLRLYPNPAHHTLTLSSPILAADFSNIAVFDMAGRQVHLPTVQKQTVHTRSLELDIHSLAAGMYLITCGEGQNTKNLTFYKN